MHCLYRRQPERPPMHAPLRGEGVDMPVTEQQARAIAFLAASVRPHGAAKWDEGGIFANVMKVADRQLSTVVIAVIQAAEDRGAKNPGVIPTAGPHWRDPESAPKPPTQKWTAEGFCNVCGQPIDGHRLTDHEPISAAEYAAQLAKQPIDVHRAVLALRDIKATEDIAHPEPPPTRPAPEEETA
jgi:hypothetical protein